MAPKEKLHPVIPIRPGVVLEPNTGPFAPELPDGERPGDPKREAELPDGKRPGDPRRRRETPADKRKPKRKLKLVEKK